MSLLFIDASMREDSRTRRLADMWLAGYAGEVEELRLAELDVAPLDVERLALYSRCVAQGQYADSLFDHAHRFAAAEEILIAAPFWNYSVPAKLHAYLELVCSQGVTFDIDDEGAYVSLCHAHRLTFVTTVGGGEVDPADDHAFGYVRTLARCFWSVPQIDYVAAWGLDTPNADIDALLAAALG